jgi:RNA polymerase sigma factor (sigma-70 family)
LASSAEYLYANASGRGDGCETDLIELESLGMDNRRASVADKEIEVLFREGTVAGLDDGQLLERFAKGRDEAAFAALVKRHGPMVLAACRGLLRDEHTADDAFQATFLVLARRAGAIRLPDRLGAWLHGVACHAAAKAKRSESRRTRRERQAAMSRAHSSRPTFPAIDHEVAEALHEEIGRLPERYRTPVVLCDLQGLPRTEAAQRLRWPLGTVNGRLSRARDILRRRLARRGITLSAGAVAAGTASTIVPDTLAAETARAAVLFAPKMATAIAAARQGMLAREVLRAMMATKATSVALGVGIVSLGLLVSATVVRREAEPGRSRAEAQAEAQAKAIPSPLDSLSAAGIPADERLPRQPVSLVSVLGERRGRHGGGVRCLALSPDGKTVATGSDQDKDIKLWDAETLQLRARLTGHRSPVQCIAISPDGKLLASGSAYGDFLLWDLRGETPTGPTALVTRGPSGFNNRIHAAAFSPSGRTLAIAGSGKGVSLWDVTGDEPRERSLLPEMREEVRSIAYAPDGSAMALIAAGDGSVRLWDMTGDSPQERAMLSSESSPVPRGFGAISVAFAPDSKTLAVVDAGGESCVCLWKLAAPKPAVVGRIRLNLMGIKLLPAELVAFSPDGKRLVAGQSDGSVRVLDLTAAPPGKWTDFAAHMGPVGVIRFSRDGRTLVTGGDDHLVRVWDATTGFPRPKVVPKGPIGGLTAVAFAPDGKTLASGGGDQIVRLWDLAGRPQAPTAELAARGPIQSLAFSPDGKLLAAGDVVWDLRQSGFSHARPLGRNDIWSLAFAPNGKTLFAGRYGQIVELWDTTTDEPRLRLTLGGDPPDPAGNPMVPDRVGPPSVVAISPDGKFLAASVAETSVRLWDVAGEEPRERTTLKVTGWRISALAFAADGKALAAGTNGGTGLWDLSRGVAGKLRTISSCGFSMVFSHDGSKLIAADEVAGSGKPLDPSHPAVCVYELATGKRLHDWELSAPSWAIALAPDGRHIAAAKQDGTVDIFRLTP